jgi:hypothetical protein
MSTPEPLDEQTVGDVEIRGGDRPEDYIPAFATGGIVYGVKPGDTGSDNPATCGPDCDCDEDDE